MHHFPRACFASCLVALAALLAVQPLAHAQVGRVIPGPSYFEAVEEIYRADYRQATRALQGEVRTAVKFSVHNRWVDSICFHTMLGEVLYQQGLYAEALDQLSLALELFESQATWLTTVNFQQAPRPDLNRGRRIPDWARSTRQVSYAEVPSSFLVAIGQIDNSAAAQQGGVIRQAQYWKLDAQEVARSVAWALYRRGKLLGPLAAHDRLQTRLAERIARGGLGPARHWSNAWVELWWGVAAASLGDRKQAEPHLVRASLLDGRSDHAMTGLALLVRGELALADGDPSAAALLNDAVVASLAYEDYPALDEAIRALHLQQLSPSAGGLHPLLEPLALAAAREGLAHIAIRSALQISDTMLVLRQTNAARERLNNLFRRQREAELGKLGIEAARLRAIMIAQQGDSDTALEAAKTAVAAQRNASLRNFQISLANAWYDDGLLTPRVAPKVYSSLLGEPSATDWLARPLDMIAAQGTDHTAALDRWFMAEVGKNDAPGALLASDAAKRRRSLPRSPLAGRLAQCAPSA